MWRRSIFVGEVAERAIRARAFVLLLVSLTAGACTSAPEVATLDGSSVTSTESTTADEPVCDPVDVPVGPNDRITQLIEPGQTSQPGAVIDFVWPDEVLPESITGDELFVECWTGAGWEQLYAAFGIYSDVPYVVEFEDGVDMAFTTDAFYDRAGSVPVADWASPGTYRFVTERAIALEGLSARGEGRFTVVDA